MKKLKKYEKKHVKKEITFNKNQHQKYISWSYLDNNFCRKKRTTFNRSLILSNTYNQCYVQSDTTYKTQ